MLVRTLDMPVHSRLLYMQSLHAAGYGMYSLVLGVLDRLDSLKIVRTYSHRMGHQLNDTYINVSGIKKLTSLASRTR